MNTTRNDLPLETRTKVIPLLAARLADATDLRGQAKQAHWSIRGPSFIAIHELLDRVVGAVDEHADDLAERMAQLGASGAEIRGTIREAAKASSLPEYPLEATRQEEHIKAMSAALSHFGASIRKAIETTDSLGDAGSSDLCTQISRSIDKLLWFIEAHGAS